MRSFIFILFICCFCLVSIDAQVARYVGTQPGDYGTIQAAINASANTLDVVNVRAGTYTENIDFIGKNITVRGINGGATAVTIDGGQNGPVVSLTRGETNRAVLEGFTITNGSGFCWDDDGTDIYLGGGIYCYKSYPKIKECIIHDNILDSGTDAYNNGGGIYCGPEGDDEVDITYEETYPIFISDCEIYDNYAGDGGGLCLKAMDSNSRLEKCEIYENEIFPTNCIGSGLYWNGDGRIDANEFHGNFRTSTSIGLQFFSNAPLVGDSNTQIWTNNIVYDCPTPYGQAFTIGNGVESLYFINNTVTEFSYANFDSDRLDGDAVHYVYNNIFEDIGMKIRATGGSSVYTHDIYFYSDCIEGGTSSLEIGYYWNHYTSNIKTYDPGLDSTYHLESTSYCIDDGDNSAPNVPDADVDDDNRSNSVGDPNDIGADEYVD